MTRPITAQDDLTRLSPVLGVRFPTVTQLDEQLARILSACPRRRERIDACLQSLHDCLLGCLYENLGSAMLPQLEDGRVRRILLEDIDRLTDLLSGLLLMALPGSEVSMEELRQRAMLGGSLGAMQALLCRYGDSLPEMERATIARILTENGAGA